MGPVDGSARGVTCWWARVLHGEAPEGAAQATPGDDESQVVEERTKYFNHSQRFFFIANLLHPCMQDSSIEEESTKCFIHLNFVQKTEMCPTEESTSYFFFFYFHLCFSYV